MTRHSAFVAHVFLALTLAIPVTSHSLYCEEISVDIGDKTYHGLSAQFFMQIQDYSIFKAIAFDSPADIQTSALTDEGKTSETREQKSVNWQSKAFCVYDLDKDHDRKMYFTVYELENEAKAEERWNKFCNGPGMDYDSVTTPYASMNCLKSYKEKGNTTSFLFYYNRIIATVYGDFANQEEGQTIVMSVMCRHYRIVNGINK